MNKRSFTDDQLNYIYSEEAFLVFVGNYFSSNNTITRKEKIELNSEEDILVNGLYIKTILANTKSFIDICDEVFSKLSYSHRKRNKEIKGEIKGRLRINEYIRLKSIQETPRIYPCVVREKSFLTAENILFLYIINKVIKLLKNLLLELHKIYYGGIKRITEVNTIEKQIKHLSAIKWNGVFKEVIAETQALENIYRKNIPINSPLLNEFKTKLRKKQVINSKAYNELYVWYSKFLDGGINFIDSYNLNSLYYDKEFDDKLFELWLLFRMKQSLIYKKGFTLEMDNGIYKNEDYIYKLKKNEEEIKIYFQKGKSILWDENDKSKWKYVSERSVKPLIGLPDITLSYINHNNSRLFFIDAKNRVRNFRKYSEEVYKMLGYYENFGDYLRKKHGSEYKYFSALVFRNEETVLNDLLETSSGDKLKPLSISPTSNEIFNENQLDNLTDFILTCCRS